MIRRLYKTDLDSMIDVVFSLGEDDRRLRFSGYLSEDGIRQYYQSFDFDKQVCFGYFLEGILVGFYEAVSRNGILSECAFTVSQQHQGIGIGKKLFLHAVYFLKQKSCKNLVIYCSFENSAMMSLLKTFPHQRSFSYGTVEAVLDLESLVCPYVETSSEFCE